MGRGVKPISFRVDDYLRALKTSLRKASREIRDEIYKQAYSNASGLNLHKHPVRLVGSDETSDFLRKKALLDSISKEKLQWQENDLLKTAVTAMGSDFQESHIGVYYEYGTGTKAEPGGEKYLLMGDKNKYRAGSRIVTRSKKDSSKGYWTDMGGNKRQSKSPKGGDPLPQYETEAEHWFENAFKEIQPFVLDRYREAIKRVPVAKYFTVNNIIIR